MPKSSLSFNPAEYALIADRITLFYERYPTGRIVTELISRDRDPDPASVAIFGWARTRPGR